MEREMKREAEDHDRDRRNKYREELQGKPSQLRKKRKPSGSRREGNNRKGKWGRNRKTKDEETVFIVRIRAHSGSLCSVITGCSQCFCFKGCLLLPKDACQFRASSSSFLILILRQRLFFILSFFPPSFRVFWPFFSPTFFWLCAMRERSEKTCEDKDRQNGRGKVKSRNTRTDRTWTTRRNSRKEGKDRRQSLLGAQRPARATKPSSHMQRPALLKDAWDPQSAAVQALFTQDVQKPIGSEHAEERKVPREGAARKRTMPTM